MAEYQEVIKQFRRICEHYRADVCCANCPLKEERGIYHCWRWISEEPEKAEEIIMNWAKKNPPVTNGDKIKEVFGIDFKSTFNISPWTKEWLEEAYKEPKDE